MTKAFQLIVLAALIDAVPAHAASAAGKPGNPMPFDLAFNRTDLPWTARPSISPSGGLLAYTVRNPPVQGSADARYLPNGLPGSAMGNRVFISDTVTGKRTAIGPEGSDCWAPSISPDGARIAFYCGAEHGLQLWIHEIKQQKDRQLGEAPVKAMLWSGGEPAWAPDGTEVFVPLATDNSPVMPNNLKPEAVAGRAQVAEHLAGNEVPPAQAAGDDMGDMQAHYMRENNATLAAVDVATGAVRVVVPADSTPAPSVLQVSPSGKWLAYLSVFHKPASLQTVTLHDIALVSAQGGPPRMVAPGHRVTEGDYFLNAYAWHSSKDQLFWTEEGKLWTYDASDVAAAPRQLAPGLADVTRQPITVTRDGKAVIVGVKPLDLHDYRDPYPQALALVPLDGGAARIVDLPKDLVFLKLLTQQGSTAWQPQADSVTVQARDPATAQTVIVRIDLRSGAYATLWKGLGRIQLAGASGDHGSFFAAYEDLNTPVDYYRFNAAFSNKRRVSELEPRLAGMRFGPVETFETAVPQYDGSVTNVTTAVLLPPGSKRGDRLPGLVFLYPGGKVSRSAAEFGGGSPSTVPVSLFTTRGYAVLLAELPIGPDGKPGNPIPEMVDTLMPQIYRAAELGYIDIKRMAVSGQSYGGYGTASVISGTNIFRAAVAISGLYDLPGGYAWMGRDGGDPSARWAETGQGRMGTHPWADLRRYIDNSPYYRADRIQTPLLMLHGQSDSACPVEDARKMFNALKRLGRTAQLAEYVGDGHVVSEWAHANAADAAQRMVTFLDRYVRDVPPELARQDNRK
ncbi:S9 family peptidase [Pseudoxanthomonas yeongjuensis]|uniref:S9 family peptidase n=1 Tax=Pseudoxanthomonas yeongjuensis TaxID=377616 RepID=UPI001390E6D3|nr:prolyl oligopeptidase family serine peptidase [Pseudoxanthomonas yeongjuensis]